MGGRGGGFGKGGGGGFKSFSDTAAYSHEYNGDGKEQVQWFKDNSNFDKLIKEMDYDQRGAFKAWTRGTFMYGQQYEGWDSMSSIEKERTQIFDDILDRATLKSGVELTRRSDAQLVLGAGHKTATLAELQAMKGSLVSSKGSMSFGAASQGLTIGDNRKKVEYKLKIPGGTKGSGMWIGDKRINGWGAKQREFMTNRDVTFKVGDTTFDKRRNIFVTEIEYVGRLPHDYGRSGRI